jgi:hypothetical protein
MRKNAIKIDMALVDDLKSIIVDAKQHIGKQEDGIKWAKKTIDQYKEFQKIQSDALGILKSSSKYHNQITSDIDKIRAKFGNSAEAIGINPSSIKEYTEALKLLGEIRENNGAILEWESTINKY